MRIWNHRSRSILVALALALPTMALLGGTARADLLYTFVDDSNSKGGPISGSLMIKSSAITNGMVTSSDVTAFTFVVTSPSEEYSNLTGGNVTIQGPMTVNAMGGFTGSGTITFTFGSSINLDTLTIAGDKNYATTNGEAWSLSSGFAAGAGHWNIFNPASVPEPASLTMLAIGGAGAVMAARRRKRAA